MKPKPRFLLLAAIASIGLIGSFAYRMFRHDIRSLTEFAASYEQFDKRMSDFSDHATEADDEAADQALGDLAVRASMRLSSLIKNDGAMMRVARELSDAATKELTTAKEYKRATLERKQVYRMALDGGPPSQATTDPSNKTQPAWSPDGRRLAFTVWSYEARFWSMR